MNSEVPGCSVACGGSHVQGSSLKVTYIMQLFRGEKEVKAWKLHRPISSGIMHGSVLTGGSVCFYLL